MQAQRAAGRPIGAAKTRPWMSFGGVGEMTAGPCDASTAAGAYQDAPLMIGPIRPTQSLSPYLVSMSLARSDAADDPLGRQFDALARRRRLGAQQRSLRAGPIPYLARPPYPYRPRPPG